MPTEHGLLVTRPFADRSGDAIRDIVGDAARLEPVTPNGGDDILPHVRVAFLSTDIVGAPLDDGRNPLLDAFGRMVERSPNLDWIHTCSSGSDRALLQEALRRGVQVTTSAGANAAAVAHSALAGMLALARDVRSWIDDQRARTWRPADRDAAPADLEGNHAVLVGVGHVGARLARLCAAVGMEVTGVARDASRRVDGATRVVTVDRLPSVLPTADWLLLCCPLTPATRGLIGRDALARLPARARLVNVSRGGIVDEPAVLDALASGRLAAMYSDVFEHEPLPADSPFWAMPNVLISPHAAGLSRGFAGRTETMFLSNLRRWVAGEPLLDRVVPAR